MDDTDATDAFDFEIVPKRPHHAAGAADAIYLANGYRPDASSRERHRALLTTQVARFPEGQFVAVTVSPAGGSAAVDGALVVGTATTMVTARPPTATPLPWHEVVGDYGLPNHDPQGTWLYGVEIAVHPAYQRRGIGTALYRARLELVEALHLEGWYAGGMLMGYYRYAAVLSPRAYGEQVIEGVLEDPTVTMQMRRGLEPAGIIEDYYPEPKAGNCAVLLTWRPAPVPRSAAPRATIATPRRRPAHAAIRTGERAGNAAIGRTRGSARR